MIAGAVPWRKEWQEKYLRECWPNRSFGQVFLETVARYPERVAAVEGEHRVSYRELGQKVRGLAIGLMDLGLKPTDRVLFQLPNVLEFIYAYWACHLAGLISVMCLPPFREKELIYLGNHTEAAAYVIPDIYHDHDYRKMALQIQSHCPTLKTVVVHGEAGKGHHSMGRLLETRVGESQPWPQPDPMEVAVLQLSGGTTGIPKVIPRTHNDYIYNNQAIIKRAKFTEKDVLMAPLPLAHNATLNHMIHPAVLTGATAVLCPFDPESISRTIERERVTHFFTVPTIFYRWLESPGFENHDYSSLRLTGTGAQKMPPTLAYRVGRSIPGIFLQVFGMTEGVVLFPELTDPERVRCETVGKPISPLDEIKVVDEGGEEVPRGEIGELICRGPYTIRGYYKAEDYNRKVIDAYGFYWSGDLVRQDPEGNVIVEGRRKDVINRGGEKISAEEIEDLLIDHPKIHRVAIIPMSDPELGEKTCAYVIPRPGAELALQDLIGHLERKKIAKFKYPERLEIVDAFPHTNVDKVSKKALREDIEDKLARERHGLP